MLSSITLSPHARRLEDAAVGYMLRALSEKTGTLHGHPAETCYVPDRRWSGEASSCLAHAPAGCSEVHGVALTSAAARSQGRLRSETGCAWMPTRCRGITRHHCR